MEFFVHQETDLVLSLYVWCLFSCPSAKLFFFFFSFFLFSLLLKILDKLLDRESQTHKPQTLSSFYSSSKPTVANQKSPSKHAAQSTAAIQQLPGTSVTQQATVSTAVQSSPENFVEKSAQGKRCFVRAMLKPFCYHCKTGTVHFCLFWEVVRVTVLTSGCVVVTRMSFPHYQFGWIHFCTDFCCIEIQANFHVFLSWASFVTS